LLAFLPIFNSNVAVRGAHLRNFFYIVVCIFFINLILIGYFGGRPVESPYYEIGQILTFFYFFIILILMPLTGTIELNIDRFKIAEFKKNDI
jgi:ubiquinol-cytochrome c reductase cytochrome b subunit